MDENNKKGRRREAGRMSEFKFSTRVSKHILSKNLYTRSYEKGSVKRLNTTSHHIIFARVVSARGVFALSSICESLSTKKTQTADRTHGPD